MPSFGFGTITSQGVGSNIDIAGIVQSLMEIERIPIDRLEAQKTSFDAKISALGSIKSAFSSFQTAMAGLTAGTSILANKASSSNPSLVTANGTSGAVAGNYTIDTIDRLAQQQKLVATGQADATATIGTGTATTLTFELGTITGTLNTGTGHYDPGAIFLTNGNPTFDVVIDSSNNTLEGIRDAINAADGGVTATIVNDGGANPYRLVLSSTSSGVDQSITITSDAGDATVDALLAHDPTNVQNLSETVTAQDAKFDVDGITVYKSSNTVTDVISGVTLNLTGITPGSEQAIISVTQDNDSAKTAVESLVTTYNDLLAEIKKQTESGYNGAEKGALASDSATRQLLDFVRDQLVQAPTGITGAYKNLSDIGVSFQRDGTLKLDESVLNTAINDDSDGVAALFSSVDGYGTRLESVLSELLTFNSGTFDLRTTDYKDRIDSLDDRIFTLEGRLERTEARLRAQFTSLDVLVSSINTTSNYLTQQLDILNAQISNG